jgi:hypothetical protein
MELCLRRQWFPRVPWTPCRWLHIASCLNLSLLDLVPPRFCLFDLLLAVMFQGGRGDSGYEADDDVSIGSGGWRYHGPVVRGGIAHHRAPGGQRSWRLWHAHRANPAACRPSMARLVTSRATWVAAENDGGGYGLVVPLDRGPPPKLVFQLCLPSLYC